MEVMSVLNRKSGPSRTCRIALLIAFVGLFVIVAGCDFGTYNQRLESNGFVKKNGPASDRR